METKINNLREKLKDLSDNERFDSIIELLSDELLEEMSDEAAEFYIRRGNAWYNKMDYDKAIVDYDKAIKINPNDDLSFYNRGFAWGAKRDYKKAIEDYDTVIRLNSKNSNAYFIRASLWRAQKEFDKAIVDYTTAIEIAPDYASAYYNRGLAKKESNIDLIGSKQDFEKYLELTVDENDLWAEYARKNIEIIDELNDKELSAIADLIAKIKCELLVKEDCVTHYTTLSTLKSLILEDSKFRLSEGNFMNDPSEGKEFFKFLENKTKNSHSDGLISDGFSPKPFIGSFVKKDKCNDLNMWRFYGKEEGIEAKGCAITLQTQKFIEAINSAIPKAEEDYSNSYKSDINFYWVVYLERQKDGTFKFLSPNLNNSDNLSELMDELKSKVTSYNKDKTSLEKQLNSIAFLFKNDAYKNENEVRLVVNGIEFEQQYKKDVIPPRIYIELVPVKNIVEQITFGPKVDKINQWLSVFHYIYKYKSPKIINSVLPYQ